MTLTKRLTSPSNPLLKEIRRAIARGAPTGDGYYVAETFHLLGEALRSRCQIGAVIAAESALERVEAALRGQRAQQLVVVSDGLFDSLAATESPQGVLALVRPPEWATSDLFGPGALVVALDGMQDPGNAGTVIRAAEAFGASGVVFLRGCVNPFNPKAMRASAGSVFRVPSVVGVEPAAFEAAAAAVGATVFAAYPSGGTPASEAGFRRPCAILVGAEGPGLDPDRWARATAVSIPTRGVESLNAAVSAAILLYEAGRQCGAGR
jgi:RNA methyltransferase, TrmH family